MVEHDQHPRTFAAVCCNEGYFQCPVQSTYLADAIRAAAAESRKLFMDAVVTMTRYEPSAGS